MFLLTYLCNVSVITTTERGNIRNGNAAHISSHSEGPFAVATFDQKMPFFTTRWRISNSLNTFRPKKRSDHSLGTSKDENNINTTIVGVSDIRNYTKLQLTTENGVLYNFNEEGRHYLIDSIMSSAATTQKLSEVTSTNIMLNGVSHAFERKSYLSALTPRTPPISLLDQPKASINDTLLTDVPRPTSNLKLPYPCLAEGSCNITMLMKHKFCKCDQYCSTFNDCCHGNRVEPSLELSRFSKYTTCHHKGHNDIDKKTGYFTITSCPDNYKNSTVITKCRKNDIRNNGPIVAVQSNLLFKNQYCGLCHNYSVFDIFKIKVAINPAVVKEIFKTFLNFSKEERFGYMLSQSYKRGSFYDEIPPESIKPRSCMIFAIDNDAENCNSYVNPVVGIIRGMNPPVYKNTHCVPVGIETVCVGEDYDAFVEGGRHTTFAASVMFIFAPTNTLTATCDEWTKTVG
ncbi:unnamed protein product [Mytilus coruscus]|uniref:SMB domain-containing protein n=1 Tax=Mytilus coruscus TaxID=42192 RepID=A0A6J8CWJ1_MYTCO|nr:unnamed protein product [Mytilus coruscus]